jgi:DNA-binding NarL/FixJ family response regulator
MKKSISIVEDNAPFQQALKRIIEDSEEFLLAAVYNSREAALEIVNHPPDIAIIDIQLPGMTGIDLIKQVKPKTTDTVYLVCSMHDEDNNIVNALESGASGYILKDSSAAKIKEAIIEISNGGAPMSSYVAKRVISFFQKPKISDSVALLSDRENQVIQLLVKGLQYKEIAANLFLSTETVKKHLRNVYQKLHVQNKVEAINKLYQIK